MSDERSSLIRMARSMETDDEIRAFCRRAYRIIGMPDKQLMHGDPERYDLDTLRMLADMVQDESASYAAALLMRKRNEISGASLQWLLGIAETQAIAWGSIERTLIWGADDDSMWKRLDGLRYRASRARFHKVKGGRVWHAVAPRWLCYGRDGCRYQRTACGKYDYTYFALRTVGPVLRVCKACQSSEMWREMEYGGFMYADEADGL